MCAVNTYNSMLKRGCFSLSIWPELQIPRTGQYWASASAILNEEQAHLDSPTEIAQSLLPAWTITWPQRSVAEIREAGKSVFWESVVSVSPVPPYSHLWGGGWMKPIEKGLDWTHEERGISPWDPSLGRRGWAGLSWKRKKEREHPAGIQGPSTYRGKEKNQCSTVLEMGQQERDRQEPPKEWLFLTGFSERIEERSVESPQPKAEVENSGMESLQGI